MTLARFLGLFSHHGGSVSSPASGAAFGGDDAVKIIHRGALAALEGMEAGGFKAAVFEADETDHCVPFEASCRAGPFQE